MPKRITKNEFVQKSKLIHQDKYDYTYSDYVNTDTKTKIYCNKHNSFFYQMPRVHLSGSGCPACGLESCTSIRMTTDNFIKQSTKVHGQKYDYSKAIYHPSKKIIIICKIHGEFYQVAQSHLLGRGCWKCGRYASSIKHKANNKVKRDNRDNGPWRLSCYNCGNDVIYTHRVSYAKAKRNMPIKCNPCHRAFDNQWFIKNATIVHGSRYNYDNVVYRNLETGVNIVCKAHGVFKQSPTNHIYGKHGCIHCKYKQESNIKALLISFFPDWKLSCQKTLWKSYKEYYHRRKCDFFLESNGNRVMIEFDGEQHFRPVRFAGLSQIQAEAKFKRQQIVDSLDAEFCRENNILLFRIKYDEDKQARIEELRKLLDEKQS